MGMTCRCLGGEYVHGAISLPAASESHHSRLLVSVNDIVSSAEAKPFYTEPVHAHLNMCWLVQLGAPFENTLEAPHVVNMQKQVRACAIATGPDAFQLQATFRNNDNSAFQVNNAHFGSKRHELRMMYLRVYQSIWYQFQRAQL